MWCGGRVHCGCADGLVMKDKGGLAQLLCDGLSV